MIWISLKLCINLFLLPLSLLKGNVVFESLRPSLSLRKEFFLPLRLSCKESSTFSPSPFSSGSGDVTALRCSEPLRSKVGGPSKVYARLCGMGPPGDKIFIVIMHSVFIGIVFYCLQIGNFIFMAYRIISYVYKFRITETYIEALKNCSCFF